MGPFHAPSTKLLELGLESLSPTGKRFFVLLLHFKIKILFCPRSYRGCYKIVFLKKVGVQSTTSSSLGSRTPHGQSEPSICFLHKAFPPFPPPHFPPSRAHSLPLSPMAAVVSKVFSPFVMLVHEKGGADGPAAAFFSPPMYVPYYVGLVRVALLDPFSNTAKHRWLAASIPTVGEKEEGELQPFPFAASQSSRRRPSTLHLNLSRGSLPLSAIPNLRR